MALKCPYCEKEFGDMREFSPHVSSHVVDLIRTNYPGVIEQLEKIEKEMPVSFIVKVDVNKAVNEANLSKGILESLDKMDKIEEETK